MIRLSRQADYAIVLLARIAGEEPRSVLAAPDLSAQTGVPVPMVSKILKLLARGGLLVSHRGARGGYSLAKPPREVSVADVLTVLEGPLGLTACAEGRDDCDLESRCSVHHAWRAVNDAVVGALSRVTLADMAAPHPQPAAPPQQQLVTLDLGPGASASRAAGS